MIDQLILKVYYGWAKYNIVTSILSGIMLAGIGVYLSMFLPIPMISEQVMKYMHLWEKLYAVINPFTTGTYILGVLAVLSYIVFDNVVIKLYVSTAYAVIMMFSIATIVGMNDPVKLLLCVPNFLLIVFGTIINGRRKGALEGRS